MSAWNVAIAWDPRTIHDYTECIPELMQHVIQL